jgi:hypothetical protein
MSNRIRTYKKSASQRERERERERKREREKGEAWGVWIR